MNPRGKQFALGGTVASWVRRTSFSAKEQAVLRRCFTGREPRTLSKYGIRQWAAPLPTTRLVVKDPFALLSVAAVHDVTGALPVLIYRHPAAVLASYRRMHWKADTREMTALGAPPPTGPGDLYAMVAMWRWCHEIVLSDLQRVETSVVVSHQKLTSGGPEAWRALGQHLGLELPVTDGPERPVDTSTPPRRDGILHDFARSTADLESGWRRGLSGEEILTIEELVDDVWTALEALQLPLPTVVGISDDS